MFRVKQIDNNTWEKFLLKQPYTLFVQSPAYGEFYKLTGEDYWVLGIFDKNETLVGGSLVVSTHAKRGDFLYLPYGPVLNFSNKELLKFFLEYLKNFAKENNFDFVRISPFVTDKDGKLEQSMKKIGLLSAPMHVLAETTWLLDISLSEEEIMGNMKKNHRNLIRRCIREGVKIEIKTDEESLNKFNLLHDETAKKHKFHRFSPEYIKNEFNSFVKKNQAAIFEAYLPDGNLDASAIIIYYGNMTAYRHAASLNLNKKIPTSYLIQWEAIKEAKIRGVKWYNFWGIAPSDTSYEHPFYGITHFKKGFGGFQKDLLHCLDLPVSKKYWLNWVIETIRRKKRGF